MSRLLLALVCCLALGGCYVEVDGHHHHDHYDGCGCEYAYTTGFVAVGVDVVSYSPGSVYECAWDSALELTLTLRNDGEWADSYHADGGYTHRFLVVDAWGHVVYDSARHHHDTGAHEVWELPVGATLTLSEVWDLTDDHGHALPAGTYTVEPYFTGELEGGRTPPPAAPIVIDILATHAG